MSAVTKGRTRFDSVQMERMVAVGETGPDFVRIWMRSDKPGEVKVIVFPYRKLLSRVGGDHRVRLDEASTDYTGTILVHGLKPLTRYQFSVVRVADKKTIGRGQFETFPKTPADTPKKVSIALMSCHQPFNEDTHRPEPRRLRLLNVLPKILSDHDVKFILLGGDQIYSDHPVERSLFYRHYTRKWNSPQGASITRWDADAVRRAYQERYRIFWQGPKVRHFYANYPCYPILDDHEIVDDWGVLEEHARKKFRHVFRGAREAYFDYQGSRVSDRKRRLPASFHYSFNYGNVGVFVMDLRSQRKPGDKGQLFSPSQLSDMQTYLAGNEDKRVMLIVVSVPVVHLPEWLADLGAGLVGEKVDFPDHWSYKRNREDRDRFLNVLYQHQRRVPRQRVILVSGDVHIGCAFAIQWKGRGRQPVLYQFTASALSNRMKKMKTEFSKLGPEMVGKLKCDGREAQCTLLEGVRGGENPFGGLNVGILEVHHERDESPVTLKLIGYPEGAGDRHVEFFVSKRL